MKKFEIEKIEKIEIAASSILAPRDVHDGIVAKKSRKYQFCIINKKNANISIKTKLQDKLRLCVNKPNILQVSLVFHKWTCKSF